MIELRNRMAMSTTSCRANDRVFAAWSVRCVCLVALMFASFQALAANVTLAWDPPTGPAPAGYYVYYGPAAGNYSTRVDVGNLTTYTVSGLVAGSTYHFAATDYDASRAESGYSNDVGVTVPGIAPVAQFAGSPTVGIAPVTVNFSNTSSGTIATYAWDFGDGSTSAVASPSHVYTKSGVYTVSLTVSGSAGSNTQTRANYVMVAMPGTAPAAQFTGTPLSGASPLTVNFTSTSTGSITSYAWDFGDGATSPVANPTHVYTVAGAYTVSLTVAGPGGANTQTMSNYVNVGNVTPPPPSAVNYQGLWWNSPANSESGWGINLTHDADTIFAAWFTYDTNGRGWWLVMTALKTAPNVYSGTLYQTQGPPFSTPTFNPAAVAKAEVGTGTLAFSDANNGTFTYSITNVSPGILQTKSITREVFGPQPTCTYGTQPNLAMATNYQDLWWAAPAGSESGWGVNFSHQGNQIFLTWFTYDVDGLPMWLVATTTQTASPSVFAGTLIRTSGPRFDAFDPASVKAVDVGNATLTFADGDNATFSYTITGVGPSAVRQSKAITREVLVAPGTTCQ